MTVASGGAWFAQSIRAARDHCGRPDRDRIGSLRQDHRPVRARGQEDARRAGARDFATLVRAADREIEHAVEALAPLCDDLAAADRDVVFFFKQKTAYEMPK